MSINFGELSNTPSALCLTTNYHYKSCQNPQIQEQCPTDAADIFYAFLNKGPRIDQKAERKNVQLF